MWPTTIHAARCILVVLVLWDQCVFAASLQGAHRSLQARPAKLRNDELRALGVPEDAKFLFQLTSDCPAQLPPEVVARMGALCQLINNTRSCFNLSADEPQLRFRGCTKKTGCPPFINQAADTVCILKGFGIEADGGDDCQDCRCGLAPEDQHFFDEDQLTITMPVASTPDSLCFSAQPQKGRVTVQVVCTEGQLGSVVKWRFPFPSKATSDPYECILSRRCKGGIVDEIAACYQNRTKGNAEEKNAAISSGVQIQSPLFHYACVFLTLILASAFSESWAL